MKIQGNLILSFALAFAGLGLNAQSLSLSSSSPTITEDFNSIWDSSTMENGTTVDIQLPQGWKIDVNAVGPRQIGAWDSASETANYTTSENLTSSQTNGSYCWGDSQNVSDRAIGGLTTGSTSNTDGKARGISLLTKITNNDPTQIITNLNLNYNIEKYRNGNNSTGFSVRFYTSNDGDVWTEAEDLITSFNPDSQTLGEAVVPISTTPVQNRNLRVHVEPGNDIYLAWNISVTSGGTCSGAPGYAIDDIQINATFAENDDDWVEDEKPEFNPSGIYMRGVGGSWDAVQEWEFSKVSDTEYVLYNKIISGTFKVADSTWSNSCNYGSNGENITMDVPYVLNSGSNDNISCGSLNFNCSRIILTIENDEATLLLEPNTKTEGLTSVYMVGDFNDWNYMNTSGELKLDSNDNLFKGQVGLTAGNDGLSHWMIYQRLALAGAWGLEQDADISTLQGILTAGEKGHVATTPGMYDVTFDLATGEYTLQLMPSTPQALQVYPSNTILVPTIPEKVKVLSLNNSLIHYNDQAKVFNEIAASMNKDATWTKHTNLGKTLQYHWEEGDGMTDAGEPGAKMMIRSDAWSHIILQEQTILPRTDFTSFSNSVKQWVEYIRTNCPNPNAVIILPLNWALAQDWSNFSDYNKILVDNYTKVAQENGIVVCPVGLAYQSKYNNDGGNETEESWFLPGDDRHPTLKATYMAALMEYALIFNENPTSVSYYPNYTTEYDLVGEMNDAIAAEMRVYADEALKAYNNTVNHHNSTVNLKASVIDQFDMEMPEETITWSVTPSTATIADGVFTAAENGEYTITASAAGLSATAVVMVVDPVTEVPDLGLIGLSEDNLEYTQDFNSMNQDEEAQIPDGWRADVQLTPRTLGAFSTASQTTLKAGGAGFTGTAKNGIWNLGDSSDESDRALGGITTDAAGGAKSINIYAAFKNEGSKYISTIDLSYNVEKYRDGSNEAGFTVQLYTSVDGRTWKNAGEAFSTVFDPSAETIGSDVVPMETRYVTGTINYDMAPGAELFLAWNISASTGESCMSAPVLAIDDFSLSAGLKPVPVFDYYIYVENNSGYDKSALYAWSENEPSEIFGAWPGQNHIDTVEVDDVVYEVYGHNQPTGTYHLIFNNNNNGSQYNDFDVEGGQNYYIRANDDGKTMSMVTTGVESIENTDISVILNGYEVYCAKASNLTVFNTAGSVMMQVKGNTVNLSTLNPGLYLVTFYTQEGNFTKKFIR